MESKIKSHLIIQKIGREKNISSPCTVIFKSTNITWQKIKNGINSGQLFQNQHVTGSSGNPEKYLSLKVREKKAAANGQGRHLQGNLLAEATWPWKTGSKWKGLERWRIAGDEGKRKKMIWILEQPSTNTYHMPPSNFFSPFPPLHHPNPLLSQRNLEYLFLEKTKVLSRKKIPHSGSNLLKYHERHSTHSHKAAFNSLIFNYEWTVMSYKTYDIGGNFPQERTQQDKWSRKKHQ